LNIPPLKTFFGLLIAALILFFLGRRLFFSWQEIESCSFQFHPLWLTISFLTLLIYSCFSVKPWLAFLHQFGKKLSYREGFIIVYFSRLGRYIPGKLWFLLGRIYLCEKVGISKVEALFSSLLELSFLVFSGGLISFCSLPKKMEIFWFISIPFIALFGGIFTLVFFQQKIFHFISRKILHAEIRFHFSVFQFLRFVFIYLLLWCFCGLAFFLFVKSLSPIGFSKFPTMTGIYASAWTVGFLSVITPSGLGVREGILSLLLATNMPMPIATLVALLSRIWNIVAELVLVGVAIFLKVSSNASKPSAPVCQNVMENYYLEKLVSPENLQERQKRAELIASILSKEIQKSTVIVDVGTGTGLIRQFLSAKFEKRILGVENQIEIVQVKEDMLISDALQMPLRTNTVDLVLLNNVVEHIFNKTRLFREVWRVLKPGGFVYLTTGSPFQLMEAHYKLPFLSWLPKPLADVYVRWTRRGKSYQHVKFVSYRRLLRLAKHNGFSVSDITVHVLKHHGQFLQTRYQKYLPLVRFLPERILNFLLHIFSPQWFILLQKLDPKTSIVYGKRH